MLIRLIFAILASFSPTRMESAREWNAFLDRIYLVPLEDVEPRDRGPYLAFFYFSEVYNGGHLQYFLNKTYLPWEETADAIAAMGAIDHAEILREAIERWRGQSRVRPESAEEYVEEALEAEFDDLDGAMYDLYPPLEDYVEKAVARAAKERENR
jgi:hypothetical protein